jgi:hypothetical protein
LRLYKSNTTPGDSDTAATYTEAAFAGYAASTLTAANWSITTGNPSTCAYAEQTFTANATATEDIYGYFVTRASDGKLLYSERFTNGPYAMRNSGDAIKITLNFSLTGA